MTSDTSSNRAAALLIALPALATFVIIGHHPVLRHEELGGGVALGTGIARIATANAAFHAVVLALVFAQALGLYAFAERLGLTRLSVRAGAALYALGTIVMVLPTTLDGFVTPLLGARCAGDPAFCAAGLAGAIAFEWAAIQAFTRIALTLQTLGLLSWSLAMLATQGRQRWAGACGALIAAAPLIMLWAMTGAIGATRLGQIMLFEALWAVGAAMFLRNHRPADGKS